MYLLVGAVFETAALNFLRSLLPSLPTKGLSSNKAATLLSLFC